ncbi:uncharacterized protein LOC132609987 isoform X2 [Lycium barbarum]|uniref:uncharacterized protein LOC132609987 isoform X2 n=1 Tax=Lycium barbarum TaxID=112863 RepID=UPI00293E3CEA|nr:uncharacterized protein LOC132609987 isoform X2 [Lycium barbarum]
MQLLQKLFKTANETTTSSSIPSISKKETVNRQKAKSKDIVLFGICRESSRRRADKSKSRSKTFSLFNILCNRKDISKEYFYSTIHLRRVRSCHRRQHFEYCMKMKKESLKRGLSFSHKAGSSVTANHVGTTQVLPITDSSRSTSLSSTNDKDRCSGADKKEKPKGDKAKTISKMKELLRWAAANKSAEKGGKYISRKVFNFRNRPALKAVPDDDQLSNDSPKISFRWEVESCSTTCSAYSAMSMPNPPTKNNEQSIKINFTSANSTPIHLDQCPAAAAKLNWITTDSEFVVLEL